MAHEHVRVDEQALEDEGVVFVVAADVDRPSAFSPCSML